MRNLRFAWLGLLFAGAWLWLADLLLQSVLEIRGIPALSALGVALFLLALASILNWLLKVAWSERTRASTDNREDDLAG
ncbi:MAG: hypothetical protein OXI54_03930 [Chloroflexota bacterium]|nr:hypothetical protein [Chloroflexota bacterium]MDE2683278.1 hypothetical protein [Chloroflexota bacterium]